MSNNRRYIKLLEKLAQVAADTPKEKWDMATWGVKASCGTVACLAGNAALTPWFKRQGIKCHYDMWDRFSIGLLGETVPEHFAKIFELTNNQQFFLDNLFTSKRFYGKDMLEKVTQTDVIKAIKKEAAEYGYDLTWSRL